MNSVAAAPAMHKRVPAEVRESTIFERNVPIAQMFVAYRDEQNGYARPLNKRRADKLASEFDPKAVGIILLSMRPDGSYAIIDGQHRVEGAERNGITMLDAYIYIDLTLEQEANLYAKFGDYLKQTARDKYFAALSAGDPEALAIERMLTEHGLRVSMNSNSTSVRHVVSAVDALQRIMRTMGPKILRETLSLLNDAFDGNPRAYTGSALNGAGAFLSRFINNPNFDRARLVSRLRRGGPEQWEQRALNVIALEKGDKGIAFGKSLLAIHNAGTVKRKLGAWPDRHNTPETKAAMAARLAAQAMPAATAKRQEAAMQRAMEVPCDSCGAPKGQRCVGTEYTHMGRLRKAAAARKTAAA